MDKRYKNGANEIIMTDFEEDFREARRFVVDILRRNNVGKPMIALAFLIMSGTQYTGRDIAVVGALVFFLSLGAPNQPGSCLIGMLIILNYMNVPEMMPFAIICEVFFGGLLNLTNVTGDIITVVCEEKSRLKGELKNDEALGDKIVEIKR